MIRSEIKKRNYYKFQLFSGTGQAIIRTGQAMIRIEINAKYHYYISTSSAGHTARNAYARSQVEI